MPLLNSLPRLYISKSCLMIVFISLAYALYSSIEGSSFYNVNFSLFLNLASLLLNIFKYRSFFGLKISGKPKKNHEEKKKSSLYDLNYKESEVSSEGDNVTC